MFLWAIGLEPSNAPGGVCKKNAYECSQFQILAEDALESTMQKHWTVILNICKHNFCKKLVFRIALSTQVVAKLQCNCT
jgi:hypothetical protein